MGLDMYLNRINKNALEFRNADINYLKANKPKEFAKIEPYISTVTYSFGSFLTLTEEVGYWRKANEIHKWFVDNVQNGVDNCDAYPVSEEQLEELLETCKKVKASINLVDGDVCNGYVSNADGEMVSNMEQGKIIVNTVVAEELLPTTEGFFFGSTDYDQWYAQDIDETIEILEKVLDETDFDTYAILYQSSW